MGREHPLGLFGRIAATLEEAGINEPYPGAYDAATYPMISSDLAEMLSQAGLRAVSVETIGLDAVWESLDEAVSTPLGTPFGPLVCALQPDQQEHVRSVLADRLGQSEDAAVAVRTMSNTARGYK